jgi:hypothetical protein
MPARSTDEAKVWGTDHLRVTFAREDRGEPRTEVDFVRHASRGTAPGSGYNPPRR